MFPLVSLTTMVPVRDPAGPVRTRRRACWWEASIAETLQLHGRRLSLDAGQIAQN
jgi:hypothetical protein